MRRTWTAPLFMASSLVWSRALLDRAATFR
jgi:hypothetical protein